MSKTSLTLIVFFFTVFVYGQSHPKTLLWKVTKKGNKNESYLFGTFHEVNPLFFNTLTNAVKKLHQSNKLFVEQRSSTVNFIPGETWTSDKWKTILTKEQTQTFTSFINKADDTSYYKLNPLLLSLTMARLYFMNFCNNDSGFTELMDTYIEQLALKEKKLVFSLDSNQSILANEMAKHFDSVKNSSLISYGIEYMKSMLNNNLSDCRFITEYKNFDIDYKLEKELSKKSVDYLLLINRNNRWTSILDNAFSSNNCFVAVGFKHLLYRQGLIQKLRELGYNVTPVPSKL